MRRALPLVLLLVCSCKPGGKAPEGAATGSKERLLQLGADLRAHVAKTYRGCTFSTRVGFDGKSLYTGRAYKPTEGGTATELNFALDGTTWRCVDADSTAPDTTTPCESTLQACK